MWLEKDRGRLVRASSWEMMWYAKTFLIKYARIGNTYEHIVVFGYGVVISQLTTRVALYHFILVPSDLRIRV